MTAKKPLRASVLIVDDESAALRMLTRILSKEGFQVTATEDGQDALNLIETKSFDLVLTDLVMGEVDGLDVLSAVKRRSSKTEVVILTGYASIPTALEAMRQGAFDYMQKPVTPDDVRSVVAKALEKTGVRNPGGILVQKLEEDFPEVIGNNPVMLKIKTLLKRIAQSDSNVLITGESGTGKEVIARAIHQASQRSDKRFVAFNCASFSEELLANELFGHEEGAYTGASKVSAGLLESADGGTVFFDEIGDMTMAMQAKLLRAIQEREILRVGGTDPVSLDIRIIAATNQDIKELSNQGKFREDLYFRLNVIPIHLPRLDERREDITPLAVHLLRKYRYRTGKQLGGFSNEALQKLNQYDFPGNVRELENVVERAAALAPGDRIEVDDLPLDILEKQPRPSTNGNSLKTLEQVEKDYIDEVLKRVDNNKSKAAKILGIDRVSLYRKLKKH